MCVVGCTYVSSFEESESAHVTFLDVGQGLSVLLEYHGRYALYDTGPDSLGFIDTLLSRGIDTLEWVVLSHNHRDHAGGFMELGGKKKNGCSKDAPRVYVRNLYVAPDTSRNFICDSVLRLANRFNIPIDTLVRGMTLGIEGGEFLRIDVLWPPKHLRLGGNASSIVLQVNYGLTTLLLPGDLDAWGEKKMLELSPMLSADLMQVGHHGSMGSSSLEFVSQVSPQYAVVSVGKNNYGHPANSVIRKFEYVLGGDSRIFRTDRDGSIEFEYIEGVGMILIPHE